MQSRNVQFGCGLCAPGNWLNFDAGPALVIQRRVPFLRSALQRRGYPRYPRNVRYGDVVKGLPVAAGTADRAYSSHVLEHLALEECRQALRNIHTYLKPGGTFRFVVPDLEQLVRDYVNDPGPEASLHFMANSYLGEKNTARGMAALPRALFGRSQHLWMWDYKGFVPELEKAGFVDIRRATIGDSGDPDFASVEDEGRWKDCLGIQCAKPSHA